MLRRIETERRLWRGFLLVAQLLYGAAAIFEAPRHAPMALLSALMGLGCLCMRHLAGTRP